MKMEECPKCGDSVEPKWHRPLLSVQLKELRNRDTKGIWINCTEKEHLHYFCRCGYDFIKEIKQTKTGYGSLGEEVEG